jgi:hypothetical protein
MKIMRLIEELKNGMIVEILPSEHFGTCLKKIDEKIFKHLKIKMFENYYNCENPIDAKMALIDHLNYYNTRDKWTNSNVFSHESWEIGVAYFAYIRDEYSWRYAQYEHKLYLEASD